MKKLYLVNFTLQVSTYGNSYDKEIDYMRLVWANNTEHARELIEKCKEFKTDEYAVYRNIVFFEANEVIGNPESEI